MSKSVTVEINGVVTTRWICLTCRCMFEVEADFLKHLGFFHPGPEQPRCGKYLGDNDATCPQLACVREIGHPGLCDNVSAREDEK